jgi:hypothetical protein
LLEREETRSKIGHLARLDNEMRTLNRELLAIDIDGARLRPNAEWQNILRLRGPQARSLRGIFDEGSEFGLMRLRPIWLMNPDVASRVLPQMPVEYALPSLFRAKRAVVSGDEKQMPPSSFFATRLDDDAAEDGLDSDSVLDEATTESERAVFEEGARSKTVPIFCS